MPEGDTVYQAAHRLDAALRGQQVTRFELRVPQVATVDLTGRIVREVVPRGKHILMRIDDVTVHSHLRMDGTWFIYRPGEKWRHPAFKVRAIVGAPTAEAVGVDIHDIEVVPTRDEQQIVGHLGPDPLSETWDAVEAARRVHSDARSIHVALLDQRNVAGFGNEYAAELLFLRGILPEMPASEVDTAALLDLGARTIRMNRDRPVRTFTGVARRGQDTWVYGRAGRPCRRCGTPILTGSQGADPTTQRVTFWCPSCQR
ncbi:Fpg/Nei family DNA glycosylase [Microbacterium bovistercoris]|uniref:DNA-(apurinic or apyrimidinic site) lyase n=1 Tax=Microbacterium bovistercoris TaxID=2293570 RepID=A0A371NYK2_9MICO|nr:DNA-formamidopyrimidine glycosylase family protein [Microbacterium bovistercoris]REJ07854.1 Fpg/Nei family DNA glycosylase [Microbacterium bovistercoris]